jgi:hypothetical protein
MEGGKVILEEDRVAAAAAMYPLFDESDSKNPILMLYS